MQIHNLKPNTRRKSKRQVGRGGKRGKTSGRGTKGQKARAGRKLRPEMRDIIKKLPKLRGRGKQGLYTIVSKPVVINLDVLDKNYSDGADVSPKTLAEKGILKQKSGKLPEVKILSDGDITKKVKISGCRVSAKAKEKLEAVGATVSA